MREMKDSGIEWIGEIPKDWEVLPIDGLFKNKNIKVSDKEFKPLSVTMQGIVPQLKNAAKTDHGDNRKLVQRGDFVINSRSDRRGACGISTFEGSVSLINTVLEPRDNIYSKFYNWFFHTTEFADEFYRWGHGIVDDLWSTNWQEMKKIVVVYPEVAVQKQIADFLDQKCSEIDNLISDIEKQIELLEEYKRSIITETVTKGLDPNVEMKDSGVEWIGEIPKDWSVQPIYKVFSERKNLNYRNKERNRLSLSYGKVIEKDINISNGLLPESFSTYNIIEPGDIVIRPTDLQNDKKSLRTGLNKKHGIITSAYITLKSNGLVNTSYFHYLLHSFDIKKVFYNMGDGVRQSLNYSEFKKLLIIVPPIKVQTKITYFLDQKCLEIDALIIDKERQRKLLIDYKKSLIFEYVTGKKEVPDE